MGVEFFPCDHCGDSICDAGHYEQCNYNCCRRWCCDQCAEADGYKALPSEEEAEAAGEEWDEDAEGTCAFCRKEQFTETQMLDWLQERFGKLPWLVVGCVPGTEDIREAIRFAMKNPDLVAPLRRAA